MDPEVSTQDSGQGFRYCAFISYRHTDRAWGDWLHKALESYRVPRELVGSPGAHGRVTERLGRVFRDREELAAAQDLSEEIDRALRASEHLVVICSPAAAHSRWVNDEILAWKRLGREDRLSAIIVDGEPSASDPVRECFPPALKYEIGPDGALTDRPADPAAADVRDDGDGKENAKLKVIAGIVGVPYDSLRRRHEEARIRAFRRFVALVTTLALTFAGLAAAATWFAWQSQRQRARAEANLDSAINAAVNIVLGFGDKFKSTQGVQRTAVLAIQAQARALLDELTKGQELPPSGQRARAVSLALSSQALNDAGDRTAALKAADEALVQMRRIADADPTNAQFQRDLARCMEMAADVRSLTGDADGTLSSYRSALAIYERLRQSNPSDPGLQRSIATVWQDIGSSLEDKEDTQGALDAFQRAMAVVDQLSEDDPQKEPLKGRAVGEFARLQAARGDLQAAEAGYRTQIEIRRRLSDADRANTALLAQLSGSIRELAILLRRRGQFAEAIARLHESAQIDQRLYGFDPQDVYAGASLLTTLIAEADVRGASGDAAGATVAYAQSIALAEELMVKGHQSSDLKLRLVATLMKLGVLESRAGHAEAARGRYRRAYEIAATVLPPDPMAPMAAEITKTLGARLARP